MQYIRQLNPVYESCTPPSADPGHLFSANRCAKYGGRKRARAFDHDFKGEIPAREPGIEYRFFHYDKGRSDDQGTTHSL